MSQTRRKIKQEEEEEADSGDHEPPTPKKKKMTTPSKATKRSEEEKPHPVALVLNRRGMPARIRKKNRLYINDDVVTPPTHRQSPKKPATTPRSSPKKVKVEPADAFVAPDKRVAQRIGVRLRNLLKLPKAHKWVCYEWFYSNIDRPLFEGDNDFMTCLKESFPQLKTRNMTRVEWCKIRRMMGKPRRCSQSFFEEERRELERKRSKIRSLQQRKSADASLFKDLPDEVPLQLTIGTKVTARLRKPQDGLFSGSIEGVDTSDNTYRITFERQGLGTHSIPDTEVLSNEPADTVSMSSLANKFRPRPPPPVPAPLIVPDKAGKSVSGSHKSRVSHITTDGMGGFPFKLLETLVRLQKILNIKKQRVATLREMNSEAERRAVSTGPVPSEFVRRYAGIVVELERLNRALHEHLEAIQDSCSQGITLDDGVSSAMSVAPMTLLQLSEEEAQAVVARHNEANETPMVKSERLVKLITNLTSIMLQLKGLVLMDGDNAFEMKVLQESVKAVKDDLHPTNLHTFQNCVELHLQHIQMGMGQRGMLAPFLAQRA